MGHGWSALILASKNGHDEIVGKLLFRDEIDVNYALDDGCTALLTAVKEAHCKHDNII